MRETGANICYVVNEAGPTSVPLDLAVALGRYEETTVDIISWYGTGSTERHRDVKVVSLGCDRRLSIEGVRGLRRTLGEYHLLQIHHHLTGFLTRFLFVWSDIPIVSRVGNVRNGFSFVGRNLNSITHLLCDAVVCNSQSVYASLTDVEKSLAGQSRFHVIPNGFDPMTVQQSLERDSERMDRLRTEKTLISNASVMTEQKGLEILLQAINRVRDQTDDPFRVVLAGDGPLRSNLEDLTANLGISDIVTFPGLLERHEVHQLMDFTDIYAMPSRWEGFSAASLEAMGIGTACVFADIDPFVQPFEDVALFHEVDDPNDLGRKLRRLLEDKSLRSGYATQARNHVLESYHMADTARIYRELYNELLNSQ